MELSAIREGTRVIISWIWRDVQFNDRGERTALGCVAEAPSDQRGGVVALRRSENVVILLDNPLNENPLPIDCEHARNLFRDQFVSSHVLTIPERHITAERVQIDAERLDVSGYLSASPNFKVRCSAGFCGDCTSKQHTVLACTEKCHIVCRAHLLGKVVDRGTSEPSEGAVKAVNDVISERYQHLSVPDMKTRLLIACQRFMNVHERATPNQFPGSRYTSDIDESFVNCMVCNRVHPRTGVSTLDLHHQLFPSTTKSKASPFGSASAASNEERELLKHLDDVLVGPREHLYQRMVAQGYTDIDMAKAVKDLSYSECQSLYFIDLELRVKTLRANESDATKPPKPAKHVHGLGEPKSPRSPSGSSPSVTHVHSPYPRTPESETLEEGLRKFHSMRPELCSSLLREGYTQAELFQIVRGFSDDRCVLVEGASIRAHLMEQRQRRQQLQHEPAESLNDATLNISGSFLLEDLKKSDHSVYMTCKAMGYDDTEIGKALQGMPASERIRCTFSGLRTILDVNRATAATEAQSKTQPVVPESRSDALKIFEKRFPETLKLLLSKGYQQEEIERTIQGVSYNDHSHPEHLESVMNRCRREAPVTQAVGHTPTSVLTPSGESDPRWKKFVQLRRYHANKATHFLALGYTVDDVLRVVEGMNDADITDASTDELVQLVTIFKESSDAAAVAPPPAPETPPKNAMLAIGVTPEKDNTLYGHSSGYGYRDGYGQRDFGTARRAIATVADRRSTFDISLVCSETGREVPVAVYRDVPLSYRELAEHVLVVLPGLGNRTGDINLYRKQQGTAKLFSGRMHDLGDGWNEDLSQNQPHGFLNLQAGDDIIAWKSPDQAPTVGPKVPMEVALNTDRFNVDLVKKLTVLQRTFPGFRKIRGDGNCYYRACIFGLLERIVVSGDFDKFALLHKQFTGGYQRYAELIMGAMASNRAIAAVMSNVREAVVLVRKALEKASKQQLWLTVEDLEQSFLHTSNGLDMAFILACKCLVSEYLESNQDTQINGLPLRDAILVFYDDVRSMTEYCHKYVLVMGEDAEGAFLELQLLPRSLGCHCPIIYLSRIEGNDLKVIAGSEMPSDPSGEPASDYLGEFYLLLRPGHYDLLYAREPSKPEPAGVDLSTTTTTTTQVSSSEQPLLTADSSNSKSSDDYVHVPGHATNDDSDYVMCDDDTHKPPSSDQTQKVEDSSSKSAANLGKANQADPGANVNQSSMSLPEDLTSICEIFQVSIERARELLMTYGSLDDVMAFMLDENQRNDAMQIDNSDDNGDEASSAVTAVSDPLQPAQGAMPSTGGTWRFVNVHPYTSSINWLDKNENILFHLARRTNGNLVMSRVVNGFWSDEKEISVGFPGEPISSILVEVNVQPGIAVYVTVQGQGRCHMFTATIDWSLYHSLWLEGPAWVVRSSPNGSNTSTSASPEVAHHAPLPVAEVDAKEQYVMDFLAVSQTEARRLLDKYGSVEVAIELAMIAQDAPPPRPLVTKPVTVGPFSQSIRESADVKVDNKLMELRSKDKHLLEPRSGKTGIPQLSPAEKNVLVLHYQAYPILSNSQYQQLIRELIAIRFGELEVVRAIVALDFTQNRETLAEYLHQRRALETSAPVSGLPSYSQVANVYKPATSPVSMRSMQPGSKLGSSLSRMSLSSLAKPSNSVGSSNAVDAHKRKILSYTLNHLRNLDLTDLKASLRLMGVALTAIPNEVYACREMLWKIIERHSKPSWK